MKSHALIQSALFFLQKPISSVAFTFLHSLPRLPSSFPPLRYQINPDEPTTNINTTTLTNSLPPFWSLGPTHLHPHPPPLPPHLLSSLLTNTHPPEQNLGTGQYLLADWRKAFHTYQSPTNDPELIRESDGFASYELTEVEGEIPDDLVGVLYRNGPGKMGVGGERVKHVLDADGVICQFQFPRPTPGKKRKITFRSKFVQTAHFLAERTSQKFLYRSTFGTVPRGRPHALFPPPSRGLNEEPSEIPLVSQLYGSAGKIEIKNSANTNIISWGGKVLALFEAGLPHAIDPSTLDTIGEDDLLGTLRKNRLPVKINNIPLHLHPSNLGGSAHTAHPHIDPHAETLVAFHWSQILSTSSIDLTVTEWSANFTQLGSVTHRLNDRPLAPHDMALTEENVVMILNPYANVDNGGFVLGLTSPAGCYRIDGDKDPRLFVAPRPGVPGESYTVTLPSNAPFGIHLSHAYSSGKFLTTYLSGWPRDKAPQGHLDAWTGFAPCWEVIPPTYLYEIVIDTSTKTCVKCDIVEGGRNAVVEFPIVHPEYVGMRARWCYCQLSNVVGDASVPLGYGRIDLDAKDKTPLKEGEKNDNIDAYWFGTRYSVGEPLLAMKEGRRDERAAYLLGMVFDAVKERSFLAVFDLERDLKEGPVAKLRTEIHWQLQSMIVP